jgi:hypothetical protein
MTLGLGLIETRRGKNSKAASRERVSIQTDRFC